MPRSCGVPFRKETVMTDRPPPYELFFAYLAVALKPDEYENVQFAYLTSKYGHRGQVRNDGGRYFDHPKAAAWIYISELGGRDPRTIIDLLLHDLAEDAYLLSPYRLRLNFGADVALDVRALTKLPKGKETTDEYLARVISRGPETIVAKLCDRLHNLRTLGTCTPEKRTNTIQETREYHLLLLIPALRSCDEAWAAFADPIEERMLAAISASVLSSGA